MTLKDFILNQLEDVYKQVSDNQVKIICPWHEETKPSLHINLIDGRAPAGVFHCFGCGESGFWNKLADKLNLKTIASTEVSPEDSFLILNRKLQNLETASYALPDKNLYEWTGEWRGLKEDFLQQFQPARYYDDRWYEWRIFFPIIYFGKLVGHLHERTEKDGRAPKHMFSPNFPSSRILYPVELHKGKKAVLVEGLADMLRLRRDGLPALCFFGCQNWNAGKANILMSLGVERVVACGDGDEKGWEVNRRIYKDLKSVVHVDIFDIPYRSAQLQKLTREELVSYVIEHNLQIVNSSKLDHASLFKAVALLVNKKKWDPGNMPYEYVKQLHELLHRKA